MYSLRPSIFDVLHLNVETKTSVHSVIAAAQLIVFRMRCSKHIRPQSIFFVLYLLPSRPAPHVCLVSCIPSLSLREPAPDINFLEIESLSIDGMEQEARRPRAVDGEEPVMMVQDKILLPRVYDHGDL